MLSVSVNEALTEEVTSWLDSLTGKDGLVISLENNAEGDAKEVEIT